MNIVVCIKQVPDTTEVKIDPVTNTLIRDGVESIVNPFDLYALEEALRLKEQHGGKVTAVCMGPNQAESALRDAIAMGADEMILLSDRKFAGSDTWATSMILAAAIRKLPDTDVVFFGQQAIDGDTAQVGPGVAAHLDYPQVCFVRKVETVEDGKITVQRLMEDGYDRIRIPLPAVVTVVKEINTPRLPSLRGKRNARTATLTVWHFDDIDLDENQIGLNGSPTRVVRIFSPKLEKHGEKLEIDPDLAAEVLYRKIREMKA